MSLGSSLEVPCAGCTLCCHKQDVPLVAGDDLTLRSRIIEIGGRKFAALDRRPDGACVYLGPEGCTVYERRPKLCRAFDCREHQDLPRAERRRREKAMTEHDLAVVRRGRELVEGSRGS